MEKTSKFLIYLMACSLQGTKPEEALLANIDMEALLRLAKAHSVSAMVCMALEQTDEFQHAAETTRLKWLDSKNKAVRKNVLLDAERASLEKEFAEHGIWYMPLKGSILKDWYPRYGMREMADNDILFDETKREQVNEIFLQRGYTVKSYARSNHDVYVKPPIFNFEMHIALFSDSTYETLAAKYADVKERLLPDEGKKYRFHFTAEDFYVFVLAHAYKHYSHSGTGIRTLADIYVMNQKVGSSMDWKYVEHELNNMGIQTYEQRSRILADKIFGSGKSLAQLALTQEEQEMLDYYLGASTYGNAENRVVNRLHFLQEGKGTITGFTRFRYCVERLFPSRKWCKDNYPVVYRFPLLLPGFWVWRLCVKLPQNRKKVQHELAALKTSK